LILRAESVRNVRTSIKP